MQVGTETRTDNPAESFGGVDIDTALMSLKTSQGKSFARMYICYIESEKSHCFPWISERGVVWEETIILLPDNVHYVFLSATIPNARQFAEWICHLHKQVGC